ncbi:hypothetical protein L228DRAFT_135505 [Xylona heveae TC161]|uniref:Protein YOP1 n=1 Tax=Xylona heveae (strain CBS 132557 / TC161) TaxID=1328760 RepID=A0A165GYI5_XYLHT|nr:hypothetical protein L228DRAFT_135505 [Xylona heveae TC161]KZF22763.1 hypothetical protein L228DRAFT_135505 [Xylona heveae TC161]
MFNIIANFLSSIITVLFPIFASYKALRTSDPAQLTPWLMYWVVLSCALLVESWTEWILVWVPFYPWIRLLAHTYLVLPQTQGARQLYQERIHPFLAHHEAEIEAFIGNAHERLKAAGLQYLKQAIDMIKEHVLGYPPARPATPPPRSSYGAPSYAQTLLARFNLPSAREGLAAPAGDLYGFLSAALGQTSSSTREVPAEDAAHLIPAELSSDEEKMSFISTQRDRLRSLLRALDNEANNLSTSTADASSAAAGTYSGDEANLSKSRSELEFEPISRDELGTGEKDSKAAAAAKGGSWMPWSWGYGSSKSALSSPSEEKSKETAFPTARGASSGVDI